MTTPATPLRLQVLERVVAILKDITAGEDYFFTPGEVIKGYCHPLEIKSFPHYAVSYDSGGTISVEATDYFIEDFYINVKGHVKPRDGDPVTAMERALRDVRVAIDTDQRPAAGAGSLNALNVLAFWEEPPTTDNGYLATEGMGFFEQRIKIQVHGAW